MAIVKTGYDKASKALGSPNVYEGTATATAATYIEESGGKFTATSALENALLGSLVYSEGVAGVIVKVEEKRLTVDKWHKLKAGEWGGTAGSTPGSTAKFYVLPGNAPAVYMGLTKHAAASESETTLPEEYEGEGLERVIAAYAHTTGSTEYTLIKTFTASGSAGKKVKSIGIFDSSGNKTTASGTMVFSTEPTSESILNSGDTLQVTETVTT